MSLKIPIYIESAGQTVAEFLIIIPAMLLLLLCSIQLVFLINAHQAVKMAAFKAARSLIVNINRLEFEEVNLKMHKSAVLSLIEVSPSLNIPYAAKHVFSTKALRTAAAVSGLALFGGASPLKTSNRYLYADKFTKVFIESPKNPEMIRRGSPIKVRVEYSFNLAIPVAKNIFYMAVKGEDEISDAIDFDIPYLSDCLKTVVIEKTVTMQSEY